MAERQRPEWIAPGSAKFEPAVGDVLARYNFLITKDDETGIIVRMSQDKDPSETREVVIGVFENYLLEVPWFAQHKAAVYIEAVRRALGINEGDADYAAFYNPTTLTEMETLRLCACGHGVTFLQKYYPADGETAWVYECARCGELTFEDLDGPGLGEELCPTSST